MSRRDSEDSSPHDELKSRSTTPHSNQNEGNDETMEEDSNEDNGDHCKDPSLITRICDVKFSRPHGDILYRVCWYQGGVLRKTWETEKQMQTWTRDPMVAIVFQDFQFCKQDALKVAMQKKTELETKKSGPGWVYEERPGGAAEDEPEVFYGSSTDQLAGETARLFDPSHKFTETEKMLAKVNTLSGKRLTRSQLNVVRKNEGSDSSAPPSRGTTPVPIRGRKTRGVTKAPPARRGRGRKQAGSTRVEQENADSTVENEVVSDEPIIQFVPSVAFPEEDSPTSSVASNTPSKSPKKSVKKRVTLEDDEDTQPIENKTAAQESNESTSAAQHPIKKRALVGRRVLSLEEMGITTAMIEQASKPFDETKRLVARKAHEELADQVDKIAGSLRNSSIQETFTQAILEGKIERARELVEFHKVCPMSSDFNLLATDRITGQNLLHKVCQISCNDAKVRRPEYTHALCDTAEYLIVSGLDPRQVDSSEKTALQYAIDKKILCRVRRLLALRAPVNIRGIELKNSILYQTYIANNRLIFKLLLDNGANFAPLEHEIRHNKVPFNKFIKEDLLKHFHMLKQRFNDAKRKVLIDIEEVHPVSPMYVANFYEGPKLWFDFHYNAEKIPTAEYFFVLFVATAVVDETNRWHLALWGDSPLETEPVLNDDDMIPIQFIEQYGPMNTASKKSAIFLGTPCVGANRLSITLNQNKGPPPLGNGFAYALSHNWKIVLQMSLLKKSRQKGILKQPTQSVLERAPDAPSSYY
ncbi:unnamed protein product, partial [Mesorhabditis belari]|uniref:Chromo domain-containing protein n=1 Tax=Mesorhabditis belari TaxID=2138241 RepID=A0AAF3FBF9_9BILA